MLWNNPKNEANLRSDFFFRRTVSAECTIKDKHGTLEIIGADPIKVSALLKNLLNT